MLEKAKNWLAAATLIGTVGSLETACGAAPNWLRSEDAIKASEEAKLDSGITNPSPPSAAPASTGSYNIGLELGLTHAESREKINNAFNETKDEGIVRACFKDLTRNTYTGESLEKCTKEEPHNGMPLVKVLQIIQDRRNCAGKTLLEDQRGDTALQMAKQELGEINKALNCTKHFVDIATEIRRSDEFTKVRYAFAPTRFDGLGKNYYRAMTDASASLQIVELKTNKFGVSYSDAFRSGLCSGITNNTDASSIPKRVQEATDSANVAQVKGVKDCMASPPQSIRILQVKPVTAAEEFFSSNPATRKQTIDITLIEPANACSQWVFYGSPQAKEIEKQQAVRAMYTAACWQAAAKAIDKLNPQQQFKKPATPPSKVPQKDGGVDFLSAGLTDTPADAGVKDAAVNDAGAKETGAR